MQDTKPVVVIDYDDVLFHFMWSLFNYHNTHFGTSYRFEEIVSYELTTLFGCSEEEKQRRVERFYNSSHLDKLEPVEGSVEAIAELKREFTLPIVTARHEGLKRSTHHLLNKHHPDAFSEVHFLGHYHVAPGQRVSKGIVCKTLGAIACVDDALHNAREIAAHGVPVFMPDRPWNQGPLPPGITRVHSWPEIVDGLRQIKKAAQ